MKAAHKYLGPVSTHSGCTRIDFLLTQVTMVRDVHLHTFVTESMSIIPAQKRDLLTPASKIQVSEDCLQRFYNTVASQITGFVKALLTLL